MPPSLAQLKVIMTRIRFLLTPDNEHNKVFREVPIIGSRRTKSLKDILVRAKIPQVKNKGWCGPCKGPRGVICKHMYLLEIPHHLLQNAHMRLDQKI